MDFKEMGSVYIPGRQNLRQVHQVQNLFYACSSKKCAKMHMLHVQAWLLFSSAHKTNILAQILGLWTFLHLLLWLNGNLFYFVIKFCFCGGITHVLTSFICITTRKNSLPKNNYKLVIQRVKTC